MTNKVEWVKSRDGTEIAIEHYGSGPTLLLVHGASSRRQRWAPVIPAFAACHHVVTMDRRGRGDSGDGAEYNVEREFEDVFAVIEHLGGNIDVLGHSYGGFCSLGALLHGAAIDRLVVYESPMRFQEAVSGPVTQMERRYLSGDLEGALHDFFVGFVGYSEEQLVAEKSLTSWPGRLEVVHTIVREIKAQSHPFDLEGLQRVKIPTLVLLGENSPKRYRDATELLMEKLPNATLRILEGQTHEAVDTAPEMFVRYVQDFLNGRH